MLRSFLKIAYRNLKKSRTYTAINILGLVLGLASSFGISKYLGFHLMKDQFHENKERIYAIHQTILNDDVELKFNKSTYNGIVPKVKSEYPEVLLATRYITMAEQLVTSKRPDGKVLKFNEKHISEVDPDFLQMFTMQFVRGDRLTALQEPNSILVTASTAARYFGTKDPIGEVLTTTFQWGSTSDLIITGVVADMPPTSNFQFDFLRTLNGKQYEVGEMDWSYPYFKSFVLLDNSQNSEQFTNSLSSDVSALNSFSSKGENVVFSMESISSQSLSDHQKMLALVGLLLLILTWINYTNLSGAKSMSRGREFGIRKVVGSGRGMIVLQFLCEGFVIYSLALIATFSLIIGFYPQMMMLTNGQLLPISEFSSPINWFFLSFFLVGSLSSAIFPSLSFSNFSPIKLLKEQLSKGLLMSTFRKSLVVFQLCISIIMLIGVAVIFSQMKYIRDQDLGINMDRMVVLRPPKDLWGGKLERMASFKRELRSLPRFEHVSSSTRVPGSWGGAPTDFHLDGTQQQDVQRLMLIGTDNHFFDCYELTLLSGRLFRKRGEWERKHAIINETASKVLGFKNTDDALNQTIVNHKNGKELKIIGVLNDYHHQSLKEKIEPQVFNFNPFRGFVSVKLNLANYENFETLSESISKLESAWNQVYPDQTFDYSFLDQQFNTQYHDEILFRKIFTLFTAISVIITTLGLFGLSMFVSLRRKKEIGIRKTFGASLTQLMVLLTKDFVGQLLLAIVIGLPIAYLAMSQWLENFSYRTSISPWLLLVPSLFLALLTIGTVVFEVIGIAKVNPIESLREE